MYGVNFLAGGPSRTIVDERGVSHHFEDHPRLGPVILNNAGDPKAKEPGPRASFWRVHAWWLEQGKKVDSNGACVWAKPAEVPLLLKHIRGNHFVVEHK